MKVNGLPAWSAMVIANVYAASGDRWGFWYWIALSVIFMALAYWDSK